MTDRASASAGERPEVTPRQLVAVTAALFLVNSIVLIVLANDLGALRTSTKWHAAIGGSLLAGLALGALFVWSGRRGAAWLEAQSARVRSLGAALGPAGAGVFILLLPILPIAAAQSAIKAFEPLSMRIVLWWVLTLIGALALRGLRTPVRSSVLLAFSGIVLGVAYQVAGYLPSISTYPLSLGWSEASRYYNASLFFGPRLYGEAVPWPVLHPSRYLMQAVPFAIGDLPLWVHRLWQALLWIAVTLGASITLARKARTNNRWALIALIGACYLFLMQGPVYYHLLLCAWVVLLGASGAHPRRTLLVVILASAWAGISRVNWYPVPAILAIVVHLLECPLPQARRRVAVYLSWPLAYAAAGVVTAFAASRAYAALSGNPVSEFASSFTSDLLWYRLLPSATYPLGVLPGSLLASAVPVLLMILWARRNHRGLHALRWLGLGGALIVLFAGGLVVSSKIGGGGNLHNLDAYLVILLVIAIYVAFDRVTADAAAAVWRPPVWLLGAGMLIPVGFALAAGGPWELPDQEHGQAAVAAIRDAATQAAESGEAVLFITERHLIAFDHLPVALEPEYEKVYLMEMAMANNQAYLEAFRADLASHRFGLIITDRPGTRLRSSERMFGEENNVWVRRVAVLLLRYYRMDTELGETWLMVPR